MEKVELKDFDVFKCKTCSDLMYSKYPGHFCTCSCGNFIDQTEYYTRMGGEPDNFEFLGSVDEVINKGEKS